MQNVAEVDKMNIMDKKDSMKKTNLNDAAQQYFEDSSEDNLEHIITVGKKLTGYFIKLYGKGQDAEDLMQVGIIGLMKALKRYVPNNSSSFTTYAGHCISGEIRNYIRKEKAYYNPNTVDKLQMQVKEVIREEYQKTGILPTMEDIAKILNLKEEGIPEIMKGGLVPIDEIDYSKIASARLESFKLPIEDCIMLEQALNKLSELQKKVIDMLFYKDMTQQETAIELGLNQKKVSRVMKSGLEAMKKEISQCVKKL